ncbi:MAG TPA: T9SS type A sorting domain-containing protein, partial [Niastella sp.]|nr:T9SS type A sorting domain-containing protein [Niastella sp.]
NRTLATPATVRLYFLDTETAALVSATGCGGCYKPASAYELGISKYSAINTTYENGTLSDNSNPGTWDFITPGSVVKVPFDKGYYAEFRVTDFSEFWLNNGGFNNITSLPVQLVDFTAKREEDVVVLQWATASEQGIRQYDVELARGNQALKNNTFQKIGSVQSDGSTTTQRYTFSDDENFKSGIRYYRLKIVEQDGSIHYSAIRSVFFSDAFTWQIYPNPSNAVFQFLYQAPAGGTLNMQVDDATGRMVKKYTATADGFMQKQLINLAGHPAGVYVLHVWNNGRIQSFKLYKQ